MTTSLYHNPNDRVMVFIDGSNLFNRIRGLNAHIQVDYGKFVAKLVGERRLVRSYYYAAQVDQNRDPEQYRRQQSFHPATYSFDNLEDFVSSIEEILGQPGPVFVALKVDPEIENEPIGNRVRWQTRSRTQVIDDLKGELGIEGP